MMTLRLPVIATLGLLFLFASPAAAQNLPAPKSADYPRSADWPRDPSTWIADREIIYQPLGTNLGTDGFDAYQPNNAPDLVDTTYVTLGTEGVYPVIMSINNNFGASSGDTLIFGSFGQALPTVLAIHSREVNWQYSYDRETYPEYSWIDPYSDGGSRLALYIQPLCQGDWAENLVWDAASDWRTPSVMSIGPQGQDGAFYEWQDFDVSARIASITSDNFCWVAVLENPDNSWGNAQINVTRLADNFVGFPSATAIQLDPARFSLRAYPNPVRNLLRLEGGITSTLDYKVHDVRGRLIARGQGSQLSTSDWAPGIYLVVLSDPHRPEERPESHRITVIR